MSAYCSRCGEEPDVGLESCIECGTVNLCERCIRTGNNLCEQCAAKPESLQTGGRPKRRLILEGSITIWSNEGGHSDPSIQIGEHNLGDALETLFAEYEGRKVRGEIGDVPGRYRITIQEIEGAK